MSKLVFSIFNILKRDTSWVTRLFLLIKYSLSDVFYFFVKVHCEVMSWLVLQKHLNKKGILAFQLLDRHRPITSGYIPLYKPHFDNWLAGWGPAPVSGS